MAQYVGNNGVIKVDDSTGALRTVGEVRSYSLDVTSDTIERTVMGNDTRVYVKGMASWSGSMDVYWDPLHWADIAGTPTQESPELNPNSGTIGATNKVVTMEIYPEGTGNKWSGDIIITGYSVSGSMDGLIEATVSFQGSGPLSFGA